jgi:hypothetical protein
MIFKKNMLNILIISLVVIIFGRLFYVENYCNIDESKTYVTVDDLQARGHYENRRDELIGEVRNSYHDMCYECLSMAEDTEACDSNRNCSSQQPSIKGSDPSFNIGEGITPFICSEAALTDDEVHAEHRENYRDGGLTLYQDCVDTIPTQQNDYTGYNNCMSCMRRNHSNYGIGVTHATTAQMEDFCNMNQVMDPNRHHSDGLFDNKPREIECVGPHCN